MTAKSKSNGSRKPTTREAKEAELLQYAHQTAGSMVGKIAGSRLPVGLKLDILGAVAAVAEVLYLEQVERMNDFDDPDWIGAVARHRHVSVDMYDFLEALGYEMNHTPDDEEEAVEGARFRFRARASAKKSAKSRAYVKARFKARAKATAEAAAEAKK
jgi:hypothetical protein